MNAEWCLQASSKGEATTKGAGVGEDEVVDRSGGAGVAGRGVFE